MLPHTALPITSQSYRQAAGVLARAFVDDPVTVAIYHNFNPEKRVQALRVDFTAEVQVCMRRGWALHSQADGKVIAAAVIYPPGSYPLPSLSQWLLLAKSIWGNGFYDIGLWMRWLHEVDRHHPVEPHYYLEYLGVEPAQQGKAVGSALVRALTDQADQARLGCYLENANPRNVAFYQRHGFQVIKETEIIGLPTWFMWRSPVL